MKHLTSSKRRVPVALPLWPLRSARSQWGGFAIGALTIGRLRIRRLSVESAKFKSLEMQDLTVTRLRAAEVIVCDSLNLPGSNGDRKISS